MDIISSSLYGVATSAKIHPANQPIDQPAQGTKIRNLCAASDVVKKKRGGGGGCGVWRAPEDEIALLLLLLRRRIYDRVLALRYEDSRVYSAARPVGSVQR